MGKIKKIWLYISVFVKNWKTLVGQTVVKSDPSILIKSLQKEGVKIDDDVVILDPPSLSIDLTRPSLISIYGGGYSTA